jgi:predicted PP-loop superfamily ATPase
MNAQEARQKAKEFNTNATNSQYSDVKAEINEKVKKGKYECKYYDSLRKDVKKKLEAEGYKINEFDGGQRDGMTITITW